MAIETYSSDFDLPLYFFFRAVLEEDVAPPLRVILRRDFYALKRGMINSPSRKLYVNVQLSNQFVKRFSQGATVYGTRTHYRYASRPPPHLNHLHAHC